MITFNISAPSALDLFGLFLTIFGLTLTIVSGLAGRRLSREIDAIKVIATTLESGALQQILRQHDRIVNRGFDPEVANNGHVSSADDQSRPSDKEFQLKRRFWPVLPSFLRRKDRTEGRGVSDEKSDTSNAPPV